jgi:hypothetical protein
MVYYAALGSEDRLWSSKISGNKLAKNENTFSFKETFNYLCLNFSSCLIKRNIVAASRLRVMA